MPTVSELRSMVRKGDDAACEPVEWNMDWAEVPAGSCGVWDGCLTADCKGSSCDPSDCGDLEGPGTGDRVSGCYWDPAIIGGYCDLTSYWTSSEVDVPDDNYAWYVSFGVGGGAYVSSADKSEVNIGVVRCVRSGP